MQMGVVVVSGHRLLEGPLRVAKKDGSSKGECPDDVEREAGDREDLQVGRRFYRPHMT